MGQPIGRTPRKFNPLVIPKSLQAALPFESKPKDIPGRKRPLLENRRAVVMEPHERKVHVLFQQLQLIRNEKVCLCGPRNLNPLMPMLEFGVKSF